MARTDLRRAATRKRPRAASEDGLEAYRRLREGITAGGFQPNERLVEGNLFQMLGAGRTARPAPPVRLLQGCPVEREHKRGPRAGPAGEEKTLPTPEDRA